jgi:C-terminal processing protease CtpA/Prc
MMLPPVSCCLAVAEGDPSGASLRLGFEEGELGQLPPGWFVPTPGWTAILSAEDASLGDRAAKLALPAESSAPFGNLMRMVDAAPFRGKRVRLRAKLRLDRPRGRSMMWLRVDRPGRRMGFFDNMSDRPIRTVRWTEALIEGDVAADATGIALGVMSMGGATAWADELSLSIVGDRPLQPSSPPRVVTDRGLSNLQAATRLLAYLRFFHPADEAIAMRDWDRFAVELLEAAEPAAEAAELADRLGDVAKAIAPGLEVWLGGPEDAPEEVPKPAEDARFWRYWIHRGAGRIARPPSLYSSRLGHRAMAGNTSDLTEAWKAVLGGAGMTIDDPRPPATAWLIQSLGGGVACRFAVMEAVAEPTTEQKVIRRAAARSADEQPRLNVLNRSTRLAGVATLWGVMQHFYPYFDVVQTDWDVALGEALSQAAEARDESAYQATLEQLVARLHDGHGRVIASGSEPSGSLPLHFNWSGDEPVVVGVHESAAGQVRAGDVVIAINGTTVEQWRVAWTRRISAATEGWLRFRLCQRLQVEADNADPCPVRLRRPDGTESQVSLTRCEFGAPIDRWIDKPSDGEEVSPGIVYFDLHGADLDTFQAVFEKLVAAEGIILDLRGYPGDAAVTLLRHLTDQPLNSARWNVPLVTLPDRQGWRWQESSWDLRPAEPRLSGRIAFLTDGRAISYAESILGIVEHYRLGEIVGGTTAGTNGNVNPFNLPGGYRISWTGMRVLKHDGSIHHGVGIRPTVPVKPTPSGIAAGRDEVLDAAVATLREQITGQ